MKIICVNGYARSGKDSFCDTAYKRRGLVYYYSTIDQIKKIARQVGWDGRKNEKGRKLLSDLKDILTEYDDLPTKYVLNEIDKQLSIFKDFDGEELQKTIIFLVQMREPEEIQKWKDRYSARALLITRPGADGNWGNHADDDVMYGNYDYFLENNSSLEEWEEKTINFIDMIRKENWESHI